MFIYIYIYIYTYRLACATARCILLRGSLVSSICALKNGLLGKGLHPQGLPRRNSETGLQNVCSRRIPLGSLPESVGSNTTAPLVERIGPLRRKQCGYKSGFMVDAHACTYS